MVTVVSFSASRHTPVLLTACPSPKASLRTLVLGLPLPTLCRNYPIPGFSNTVWVSLIWQTWNKSQDFWYFSSRFGKLHIFIWIYIHVYICEYIYIERERNLWNGTKFIDVTPAHFSYNRKAISVFFKQFYAWNKASWCGIVHLWQPVSDQNALNCQAVWIAAFQTKEAQVMPCGKSFLDTFYSSIL